MLGNLVGQDGVAEAHRLDQGGVSPAHFRRLDVRRRV